MILRERFLRHYTAVSPRRDNRAGMIRVVVNNGIVQTWAISRPVGAYHADCAPQYLSMPENQCAPRNQLIRTATPTLMSSPPLLAMDPSDPSTWQRRYIFT
jgi:hypothetical protein